MARRITTRKTTYRGLDDRFDVELWASVSPAERFAEAWRLSEELWQLKGWDPVNEDFRDLLRALSDADARFLVVGAYAVSYHAEPRATGDLDLWVDPAPENAERVHRALAAFGAPLGRTSRASAKPSARRRSVLLRDRAPHCRLPRESGRAWRPPGGN